MSIADVLAQRLVRGVSENRLGGAIEQRHLAARPSMQMMASRAVSRNGLPSGSRSVAARVARARSGSSSMESWSLLRQRRLGELPYFSEADNGKPRSQQGDESYGLTASSCTRSCRTS